MSEEIEDIVFDAHNLGEVLEGVFESSEIVEDGDLFDAAVQFRNAFKPVDNEYTLSLEDLFGFVQRIEKDCIDKVCLSLVDKGFVSMGCDEDGEINYQATELGKVVCDEEKPEETDK